eukprot:scaffold2800_cov283-Chaetoceros_neogracile.AAC.1
MLSSSVQWRQMTVQDSLPPGFWMESLLDSMRDSARRGNPNVDPDIEIYHRMMEFYKNSTNFVEVSKNVKLLKEMLEIGERNREGSNDAKALESDSSCRPTVETYNLAVSGFHGIGSTVDIKVKVIEAADEVLRLMEEEYCSTGIGVKSSASATGRSQNAGNGKERQFETNAELIKLGICDPYRAMLQNLIAVGPKALPDYQRRVDDLMERMMGKRAYGYLLEDNGTLIDISKIDHLVLHDLIHTFSITNDKKQLAKARIILKKMEATRDAALQGVAALAWPEKFPVANSYKSVIIGILHSTIDADDENIVNKVASIEDALYATELLDTILQEKSALRNSFSCYRVIRLWGATNSKEAGKRGEEILGRLEISQLINGDPRSDQSSMRDVVLRSINNLRWRIGPRLQQLENQELQRAPQLIRACAETVLDEDKEDALEIAFSTYNTMVEEEVILTPYVFVQMMKCCQLVAPSSHYQALKLSKEVFQAACSNGLVVNKHVLFLLKQVNYYLFESYKKKPEHSTNVKKMMPLEE